MSIGLSSEALCSFPVFRICLLLLHDCVVLFQLRSLNISYCQELTERGINAFLRKQSCMESFSARYGALTNLSLGLLSSNFRMLRSLNIASVEAISGSGLVSMMKSLHYLEFIDLSWAGGSSE